MSAREELGHHVHEIRTLSGVLGLLSWDQQVNMPPGGAQARGAQLALLSEAVHARVSDPRLDGWLTELADSDDPVLAGGVRNLRRKYDRACRIPTRLVGERAVAEAEGFEAWMKAREAKDFSIFAPALQRLVDLSIESAQHIDGSRPVYDVLLDDYDPGTDTASLEAMFTRLGEGTVQLLEAVGGEVGRPLEGEWDVQTQRAVHSEVARALGYDMNHGSLDEAEHPFTVGVGDGDIRITTHFYPQDLLTGLSGTIHECGHAMYEQGIPLDYAGTGAGEAASMGLHESQSRFWENTIGRSREFCGWLEGVLSRSWPGSAPTAEALYLGNNHVKPGLIRVYADEVTYNLHVVARFNLERALFAGEVEVRDLRDAWNAQYESLLGICPSHDTEGVLQDVHWSGGAFGYFPSYTLGNLYAASLGKAMQRELPEMWSQVAAGEFTEVLAWLRDRVHRHAHVMDAPEIVRQACGETDSVEDLLDYLWARYGGLAGVSRPA